MRRIIYLLLLAFTLTLCGCVASYYAFVPDKKETFMPFKSINDDIKTVWPRYLIYQDSTIRVGFSGYERMWGDQATFEIVIAAKNDGKVRIQDVSLKLSDQENKIIESIPSTIITPNKIYTDMDFKDIPDSSKVSETGIIRNNTFICAYITHDIIYDNKLCTFIIHIQCYEEGKRVKIDRQMKLYRTVKTRPSSIWDFLNTI
ncbi:MAG TPA: hypothetical protein PLE74_06110 [Candidatus Cloacimonadota bacterium]|nr:hypothetical protein [Candidatus Cloacimonadota bacterium]